MVPLKLVRQHSALVIRVGSENPGTTEQANAHTRHHRWHGGDDAMGCCGRLGGNFRVSTRTYRIGNAAHLTHGRLALAGLEEESAPVVGARVRTVPTPARRI